MMWFPTSVVGAIHELPLQRGSIYHQRMIHKNLKRRIYVDTQHDYFVQCVSPNKLIFYSRGLE